MSDDSSLVAAAVGGDRGALDSLLRRQYERVYGVCRRITGDDADAADACQEALVAIVRGLPRFDNRSSFSTWVYRVATNAALDELRRRRRRPEPGLPDSWTASVGIGDGMGVGDSTEAVVTRLTVDAAVAGLPPDFRAAVVLRDFCDLSYEEIADVLEIPPGTVRSRIARARAAVGEALAQGNRRAAGRRPTERT